MSDLTLPVGARDHIQGKDSARVTLVEYGDYECPYCSDAYLVVKAVQQALGDDLRFVFRNFPLTQAHPHAELAAEVAEAAAVQGKFWETHDALYENQDQLEPDAILELVGALGVDRARLVADLEARRFLARVKEDFMSGVRSGVNGTPGFFINGTRYQSSWDEEALLASLIEARDSSLGAPRRSRRAPATP